MVPVLKWHTHIQRNVQHSRIEMCKMYISVFKKQEWTWLQEKENFLSLLGPAMG